MAIVITEGLTTQYHALAAYGLGTDSWMVALSADTPPYSDTTTFGDMSVAIIGGVPLQVLWGGWVSIAEALGSATGTMAQSEYSVPANTDSVTLTQWVVYDPVEGRAVWSGDISPPYTPTVSGSSDLVLRGITVTLGQCSPSAPSGGLMDGLFDAPAIPSASFTTAPAWPPGTWVGGSLASQGSAYEPPSNPPTTQYILLQGVDTIGILASQVFSVTGDTTVRMCGAAAQRTFGSIQTIEIEIDGGSVAVLVGSDFLASWGPWSSDTFFLGEGSHTVTFTSLAAPPADATMFLAMISLIQVS
jgi:hypothetical protein